MSFLTILLPIFSVFAIGYGIGKYKKLDIKSLSFVAIYVLCPFLGFETFYANALTSRHLYIFAVIGLLVFVLVVLILLISRFLQVEKKRKHAMLLSGVFLNGGNLGVPVVLFTIGEEGFIYALMIMVVMDLLMNSLGIYIAASGGDGAITKKESLIRTVKVPILWASIVGILLNQLAIPLPVQVEDMIVLLADAAIPLVMIVLGLQLATIKIRSIEFRPVGIMVLLRLVISPLIAFAIVSLMGIGDTVLGTVLVLIAAMPSAANTTIFSVQFHVDPDFVSATTLLSTIVSLFTLPIWLTIL